LKAQDLKLGLPVGHTSGVYSAVFSPDGTKILTGSSDKTARLWESSSGKLIHSLEGHTSGVNSAVFSPDGTKILTSDASIYSGSSDNTARLWESSRVYIILLII
jgi:WD40 repeat protein